MPTTLLISPTDNVAVALCALGEGERAGDVVARQPIPVGHKVALVDLRAGDVIRKYGYSIGRAGRDIRAGEHVHSHNVVSDMQQRVAGEAFVERSFASPVGSTRSFDGYRRADGRVATRNELWIIPTVGCVNHAAQKIAELARAKYAGVAGIDGIHAFPHPFGCSQLGDDLANTRKVLAGLARHPNAGAVLVIGLGCENNRLQEQIDSVRDIDASRIRFFNAQDVSDEVEIGLEHVAELVTQLAGAQRTPVPINELVLGMKCGGSDGFSGISANPLVGRISDALTAAGGTALLTEVPEMFGAERVLLDRCVDRAAFDATVKLVDDFRDYFRQHNEPIDENPSPGNKDGGITTLAEKSLGCVQKGGNAPVKRVLRYGESAPTTLGGVALIEAPGNDGVSCTTLTMAGAHAILFTTGRGTPMGFPVPTIKISTNTSLSQRKPQWIDFNAGPIADGSASIDDLAKTLLDFVIDTASGRPTKNETNGWREIAIWKTGITL
jgi:altronate hydrolase